MEFGIGQFVRKGNEKNFFSLLVAPVGPITIKMFDSSHPQPNRNTDKGTAECWCTTECRFCFELPSASVKNTRSSCFEEVLQRALFKTLVITV